MGRGVITCWSIFSPERARLSATITWFYIMESRRAQGPPQSIEAAASWQTFRDSRNNLITVGVSAGAPANGAVTGNGQGQNRTADTVIFSHVLYQLSYLAQLDREL